MCIKELKDKEEKKLEIEKRISEYNQAEKELNLKYKAFFDELALLRKKYNYDELLVLRHNNAVQLKSDSKFYARKLIAKLCMYYNELNDDEQDKLDSDLEAVGLDFCSVDSDEVDRIDIDFMSPHNFIMYVDQPNSAPIRVISFNMPVSQLYDTLKKILPNSFFEEG